MTERMKISHTKEKLIEIPASLRETTPGILRQETGATDSCRPTTKTWLYRSFALLGQDHYHLTH